MKEQMTTIKMKTNDMERHCNLLLNRVLAECNISVKKSKEKSILVKKEGCSRVIGLEYRKESSKAGKGDVWFVRIILLDSGDDSAFYSYYDKESMSVVHDVCVYGIIVKHNGEEMDFDEDRLIKTNDQVLADLRKPLNIGMATTYGQEDFKGNINLIPLNENDIEKQLEATTRRFFKECKDMLPSEFSAKINFVRSDDELYDVESDDKMNVYIESKDFVDHVILDDDGNELEKVVVHEYLVRVGTYKESEMCICLQEFNDSKDNVWVYYIEDIFVMSNIDDGYVYICEKENKMFDILSKEFVRAHEINVPKFLG